LVEVSGGGFYAEGWATGDLGGTQVGGKVGYDPGRVKRSCQYVCSVVVVQECDSNGKNCRPVTKRNCYNKCD